MFPSICSLIKLEVLSFWGCFQIEGNILGDCASLPLGNVYKIFILHQPHEVVFTQTFPFTSNTSKTQIVKQSLGKNCIRHWIKSWVEGIRVTANMHGNFMFFTGFDTLRTWHSKDGNTVFAHRETWEEEISRTSAPDFDKIWGDVPLSQTLKAFKILTSQEHVQFLGSFEGFPILVS